MLTADAVRDQCSAMLWDVAPLQQGETVKAWLYRVAVATGFKPSLIKRLRYQEVPTVPAHVAFQLQAVAERARAARSRAQTLKDENDRLLVAARQGLPLDLRSVRIDGGLDAAIPAADMDPRQMALPLTGWMR